MSSEVVERSFTNGNVYKGEIVNSKLQGKGELFWKGSGDSYVGEFDNDIMHGSGKYTYNNKDKYVGLFQNGKKHGQGVYTYGIAKIILSASISTL